MYEEIFRRYNELLELAEQYEENGQTEELTEILLEIRDIKADIDTEFF
jgi:hypothetical protein